MIGLLGKCLYEAATFVGTIAIWLVILAMLAVVFGA